MSETDQTQAQAQCIDYERLGREIAQHMHATCPMGWTAEDIQTLRQVCSVLRRGYATALYVLVTSLVGGVLTLLWKGLVSSYGGRP